MFVPVVHDGPRTGGAIALTDILREAPWLAQHLSEHRSQRPEAHGEAQQRGTIIVMWESGKISDAGWHLCDLADEVAGDSLRCPQYQ